MELIDLLAALPIVALGCALAYRFRHAHRPKPPTCVWRVNEDGSWTAVSVARHSKNYPQ